MGKPIVSKLRKKRSIKGAVQPVDTGNLPRIHRNLIERPGDREVVGKSETWLQGRNSLADAIDAALKEDNNSGTREAPTRPRHNARQHSR